MSLVSPDDPFAKLLGIALFGTATTWLLIFATHAALRRWPADDAPRSPLSLPGGWHTSAAAAVVSMLFVGTFRVAWTAGAPTVEATMATCELTPNGTAHTPSTVI
ncbi:hypothetical protein KBX71_06970 [Micromonospora sp. D93]|uniref:hypothetical protein n=1 Tax=Micromonospora sp. D93 TaxID=2824886 RepID=UPI001B3629B3|nr:hypothetical protein [Micromonospora sp. D93]MBQ1017609.1 hypothetical protein [Micromonospora sp. D93]